MTLVTLLNKAELPSETPDQAALWALFEALGIAHRTYAHPPIFTVEEGVALNLPAHIPGQSGKSLFLTNQLGELWLVVACEETRVNLKALSDTLQTKRFSFGKPESMLETLGVTPGSVTPFALINDIHKKVQVVLDEEFFNSSSCVFHPLKNTHSTAITVADLCRFIEHLGYPVRRLKLA